jgi:hypothetical protein
MGGSISILTIKRVLSRLPAILTSSGCNAATNGPKSNLASSDPAGGAFLGMRHCAFAISSFFFSAIAPDRDPRR